MPLQPIPNYITNLPNPAEQVQKDLQFYVNMQQAQAQNNLIAAQVQEHQLKAKAMQEKQIADARTYAYLKELSANPTVENIRRATIMLPDKANELKVSLDSYTAEQKQKAASEASSLLASVYAGDMEVALKQVDRSIEATANSGDSGAANSLRVLKRQLEQGNRTGALATSSMIMAQTLPPEQYAAALEQLSNLDVTRRSKEALAKGQELDTKYKPAMLQSTIDQNRASAVGSLASAASARATAAKTNQETTFAREDRPLARQKAEGEAQEALGKGQKETVAAQVAQAFGMSNAEVENALKRENLTTAELQNYISLTKDVPLAAVERKYKELELKNYQAYGARQEEAKAQKAEADMRSAEIAARFAADRAGSEIAETATRIAKTQAEILEIGRKAKSPDRSQAESALLTKYSAQGTGALQSAKRMTVLADRFAKSTAYGGVRSWARDQWVRIWGTETPWDIAKKDYAEIANKMASERLPPGPASNQDVAFAREALLSPNAQPSTIAKALRILAAVQEAKAVEANFRNKWVWHNRHEGPAEKSFEINGIKVSPGQSQQEVMFSPQAGSMFDTYKRPSEQQLSKQARDRLNLYRGSK